MNPNEVYRAMFKDYPDVVNVEQMCEMLGGMSSGSSADKHGTHARGLHRCHTF